MKLLRSVCLLFVCLLALSTSTSRLALRSAQPSLSPQSTIPPRGSLSQPDAKTRARLHETFGQLPLSFEANQGQTESEMKFLSRGNGYQLSLKATEAVLELRNAECGMRNKQADTATWRKGDAENQSAIRNPQSAIVKMQFMNANPTPQMAGRDELPGKSHYYIGNDPKDWRTNVANYAKVEYEQVWPGINLVYYGKQRQLEYDFIVAPGADPNTIHFTFDGADKMKLDARGNLVLHVADGEVVLQKPFIYQEVNGARQEIAGNYQIRTPRPALRNREVGFHVGEYDRSLPLVIDPVLVYSTYLGGSFADAGQGIAVDAAGNAYVTGSTSSANFPLEKALDPTNTARERSAFVTKINAAGTALVYSTYLGGSSGDSGLGIAVDASGNAYVTGVTRSTDFPTKNPLQAMPGGGDDAFVVKLNAAGSELLYSTYLGGSEEDGGQGIAVDAAGNAYLTGYSRSTNFPTANPLQPMNASNGFRDAFIAKLNAAGSALAWSTYLGGSSGDEGRRITVDSAGNAYVIGQTSSTNFRTANPLQAMPGGSEDAFVAKLNAAGSALLYSTYLGGSSRDEGNGIAIDSSGNAYVTGVTDSTNFPVRNPLQAAKNGPQTDAFVAKLNAAGSALDYATYLGGTNTDIGNGIAVTTAGEVWVTGQTDSANFPTVSPVQPVAGGSYDVFVTKLNAAGSALTYSTYLGGNSDDIGRAIVLDASGNVFVTGDSSSTSFRTEKPFQSTLSGVNDAFIAKISDDAICPPALLPEGVEADSDKLALSNVMPPDGDLVSGASLKIGGLKGTVTWLLQSQNDATLVVRLFDQDGNTRGDAGSITVTKSTQCPPKESGQDFVFDRSKLDLTPLNGIPVTRLTLSAIMSGRNGEIIKRVDVNYRVIPDAIAFDGTPKINGLDAPDGSQLPSSGTINFTSTIKYHLTSDLTGKIRLQVFNANGGGQIASKDLTPTVAATAQPTLWNTPLDFQFAVPPNVSEISIVASLLAENGTLLKSSTPLFYGNKLPIELGFQASEVSFIPLPSTYSATAGTVGSLPSLALRVKRDLPANLRGSKFVVRLAQRFNNGDLIRGPYLVDYKNGDDFPRPSFRLNLGGVYPDDVDKWEFQLLIFPPNDAPQIESEVATLSIDRIRIVTANPAIDTRLQTGMKQEFVYSVAYNNKTGQPRTIKARVKSVLAVVGKKEETIAFNNGLKAVDASNSTGEKFKFTLDLPPNLLELQVVFFYDNTIVDSEPKTYTKFDRPAFRFNAEEKQFINGLGVDVATVENKINRLIAQGRSAQDAKQAVVEALLKARSASSQPESGSAEAVAETLATSSLFQNFVGLNATWQFDPPIPADGSFVADLKFYYRAEDLPDDPNFNEATMKVIGFDPATGKMETYPTTLDLNAKTATVRVNGLLPIYSLGVTGPFAERAFNFPVLRSLDDFTTQLHFASVGTGSAALNTRAFDSLGQLFSGSGLVNPATNTLSAGRTLTVPANDLFKFNGLVDGGWMQTHADKNFVAAYQILGKDNRLDGLTPPAFLAGTQVLTSVQYDATTTTEIHLANVTKFTTNLTLDLRTSAGTQAGSYETTLEPKETFARRVQDIFSNLPQPFTGYVIVRGDHDLSAAALQISDTEILALNGQVPVAGNTATKLYAPYVLTDNQAITTRVNLINPTTNPANLTLRLVNETGANLAPPVSLPLTAGQQSQRDVAQLFGFSPGDVTYGSLMVESSVSGIVGDVSYYDPAGQFKFRAALPLESEAAKFLAFAHLDNGEDSFTDVGLFNPGTQTANVTFRVLRADGAETGRATGQIPAGAHYSNFLDTIVEASFGQVGGSFTITSDQPILAAAAFGPLNGTTLSALPAQAFDPTTFTRANTTVSAASYRGPELAADSIVAAFGAEMATSVAVASSIPLPTTLAGTTVRVRDSAGVERLAPLFFVAPQQVNYLLPPATAPGAATVTITSGAGAISTGAVQITSVAAGLFAANSDGQGPPAGYAVRVRANGAQLNEAITRFDSAQNKFVLTPLDLGPSGEQVVVVLFGTGFRAVSSLSAVNVKIGGVNAEVLYAGTQGGFVGLDQMNLLVPRALLGRGEVELAVTINGQTANTLKINFK